MRPANHPFLVVGHDSPGRYAMSTAQESLQERLIPRRAAAKRASKLSAEQLESSPPSSDTEANHVVGKVMPFGEPVGSRSGVKYTYGSKGKSRRSLTESPRVTGDSPQSSGSVRKRPLAMQPSPRGRTSQRAEKHKSHSTSSHGFDGSLTPLSNDDFEDANATRSMHQRIPTPSGVKKSTPIKMSPRKKTAHGSSEQKKRRKLKRRHSLTSSQDSLSDVESSPKKQLHSPLSKKTSSMHRGSTNLVFKQGNASVQRPSTPPLRSAQQANTPADDSQTRSKVESTDKEEWSMEALGMLVWVKMNELGNVLDNQESENGARTIVWWPAKVTPPSNIH